MKHVVFGSKSLLTGSEASDLLGRYAALLGRVGSADYVELACIDPLGNDTTAGFLLNSGASLVVESASAAFPEPDNADVIAYMRAQLASYDFTPGPTGDAEGAGAGAGEPADRG